MYLKPCAYCYKNKRCKKQTDLKKQIRSYGITTLRLTCGNFKDRFPEGQRVIVTNLYTGKYEDICFDYMGNERDCQRPVFISHPLLATVIKRCKTSPTKLLIELDQELEEDEVGENCYDRKKFATKEINLKKTFK